MIIVSKLLTISLSKLFALNNKSVVINGTRFIGGTLWTSLGSFFPWVERNQIIKRLWK